VRRAGFKKKENNNGGFNNDSTSSSIDLIIKHKTQMK
jgi:hypothetical protein